MAKYVEEVITPSEGDQAGGPPGESPGCGWKDGAFCSWRWEGGECRYRQRVRKVGGRWKQQDILRAHVHFKLTRTDPPSLHSCVVLGKSLVLSGPYCFGFTMRRRQRAEDRDLCEGLFNLSLLCKAVTKTKSLLVWSGREKK